MLFTRGFLVKNFAKIIVATAVVISTADDLITATKDGTFDHREFIQSSAQCTANFDGDPSHYYTRSGKADSMRNDEAGRTLVVA